MLYLFISIVLICAVIYAGIVYSLFQYLEDYDNILFFNILKKIVAIVGIAFGIVAFTYVILWYIDYPFEFAHPSANSVLRKFEKHQLEYFDRIGGKKDATYAIKRYSFKVNSEDKKERRKSRAVFYLVEAIEGKPSTEYYIGEGKIFRSKLLTSNNFPLYDINNILYPRVQIKDNIEFKDGKVQFKNPTLYEKPKILSLPDSLAALNHELIHPKYSRFLGD